MNDHGKDFPYKGQKLRRRGGTGTDEVFTLEHVGTINISKLTRFLLARRELFQLVETPLTQELADDLRRNRDLDPARLASLTEQDVNESFAIAILWDGEVHVVDGNHYVVKAADFGHQTIKMAILPQRLVPQFLVHFEVKRGKHWVAISADEILAQTAGNYSQPDGTIRDATNTVVARFKPIQRSHEDPLAQRVRTQIQANRALR
jgi:hypothetical protein